jgi:transposase-like protein
MTAEERAAAPRTKRRARTKLERRKIVEESLLPGTSVTSVARAHGVRPNQVHHWRRLYKQGLLGAATTTALVAVKMTDPNECGVIPKGSTRVAVQSRRPELARATGSIQIETERARMCIQGAADLSSLRLLLECLLG